LKKIFKYKGLIILLFVFISVIKSQQLGSTLLSPSPKQWFVSAAWGGQISGIKNEDFIISNLSPSIKLNTGLWFTPEIAVQLGYKGYYFNYIGDSEKHFYNFYYGEALFNINEFFNSSLINNSKWFFIIHSGAGYFYNKYYNRPNVCGNLGLMSLKRIKNYLSIFVDVSAILGWDIYQGNDDILPSCVVGVTYLPSLY